MALRMTLGTTTSTLDVTQLTTSITLSGELNSVCRTLTVEVIVSPSDKNLPAVEFPLGAVIRLYSDDVILFHGTIIAKDMATSSKTMTVTCFDRGFFLKCNDATARFDDMTPEAAVASLCPTFGIGIGQLAETGVTIKRKFNKTPLYKIFDTLYTLASEQNGKKYMIRFTDAYMYIFERQMTSNMVIVQPGSNLQDATYSESTESMINRVAIEDTDGNFVTAVSDDDAVKTYGLMRTIIRQEEGRDAKAEAQKLIDENGVERKCTITVRGDPRLITGETVYVREPFTGLLGVFWIDGDKHTWKDGDYTTKLTLSYKAMMREGSAGEEIDNG